MTTSRTVSAAIAATCGGGSRGGWRWWSSVQPAATCGVLAPVHAPVGPWSPSRADQGLRGRDARGGPGSLRHTSPRRSKVMPVATAEQYAEMLDRAVTGRFAFPGVNVTSSQTLNGVLRGLADAGSDGIVQVTVGGAKYLSGGDALAGARALAAMARELAGPLDVLVGVHTDHAPPSDVDGFLRPLLADSVRRRQNGGAPLFNSHMFDGSTLTLEENLGRSSELLDVATAAGVLLEVEVGAVGGEEDGV